MTNRPWGVHALHEIYHPDVKAGLPNGRYVAAVCSKYPTNARERIRAAWWVLTGRAEAFIWPQAGDLEAIWEREGKPSPYPPRPFVAAP